VSKKLSYKHVKDYIEEFGYQLATKEYRNVGTKLNLICPEGHNFEMTYSCFYYFNHRCPTCQQKSSIIKRTHTYEFIKNEIENKGYKLLSKKYQNALSKLKIQCPEGHNFEMRFNNFQQGQRCPICWKENKCKDNRRRLTYEKVQKYFIDKRYTLLSNEYKNKNGYLEYNCPYGHYGKIKWNNFQQGQGCPICNKHNGISKTEKEILNYVKSIYTGKVIENNRTQIINPKTGNYLELDIFLPELNKAIEYNGTYWHDIKETKNRDYQKLIQCEQRGIELLVIKEEMWLKSKDFRIINNFIGVN